MYCIRSRYCEPVKHLSILHSDTGSGDLRQTAVVELNTSVYTAEGGREGGRERDISRPMRIYTLSISSSIQSYLQTARTGV